MSSLVLSNNPKIGPCDHEWVVFSTALLPPTILVQCVNCGAYGGILESTKEEWALAFYAPDHPFRWADAARVVLQPDLPKVTEAEVDEFNQLIARMRAPYNNPIA